MFLDKGRIRTRIPDMMSARPHEEINERRSPTITTPRIAAVSGSASDNVIADETGIISNPFEKR